MKINKGKSIVIPKFNEMRFNSEETERVYRTYTRRFLKKLLPKNKLTLKAVRNIKWKQILKFFKNLESNK